MLEIHKRPTIQIHFMTWLKGTVSVDHPDPVSQNTLSCFFLTLNVLLYGPRFWVVSRHQMSCSRSTFGMRDTYLGIWDTYLAIWDTYLGLGTPILAPILRPWNNVDDIETDNSLDFLLAFFANKIIVGLF